LGWTPLDREGLAGNDEVAAAHRKHAGRNMVRRIPDQPYTCPEAMYWKPGDVILIGKGENAHYFKCLKRLSQITVLIGYYAEGGNDE